jgi:elongation factor Ts
MKKVTAEMVKELRMRTGVSMGKCKEALEQSDCDMENAIDFLRKAGMASAVKKEGREANEGLIGFGESDKAFAIIEINSETDFVAQNEKFKQFIKDICSEASEMKASTVEELLNLKYSKDPSITIDQHRALTIQELGENIQIKRMLIIPKEEDLSVGLYSHMGGKIVAATLLKGAKGQENIAREISMHIAAESPEYLHSDEIPEDVKSREKDVAKAQMEGKPANMIEKIIEGKMKAFYDQVCLVNQKFIKDSSLTVADVVEKEAKSCGKPLTIQSFIRWKVGG